MRQIFVGGGTSSALSNIPTTGASDSCPFTASNGWGSGQSTNQEVIIAATGTLKNFIVYLTAAPGAGISYSFLFYKNNTVTTFGAVITGSDTSSRSDGGLSVTAGDRLFLRVTVTGTGPTNQAYWSTEYDTGADSSELIWPAGAAPSMTADAVTRYNWFQHHTNFNSSWSTSITGRQTIVPFAGTIKTFYIRSSSGNSPGAGTSWRTSLMINGVEDASSVLSLADTNTTANLTGLSIAVNPGDTIALSTVSVGAPAVFGLKYGVSYIPTNSNEGMSVCSTSVSISTIYLYPNGSTNNASETLQQQGFSSDNVISIKNFYVLLTAAPGGAETRTFTIRRNGVATGSAVTISAAATTGNSTTEIFFVRGDKISIEHVPSAAPAAATCITGFVTKVYPPGYSANSNRTAKVGAGMSRAEIAN